MTDIRIRRHRRNKSGFTLIELMIAMALGLFLVAGVTTLVVAMSRDHRAIQSKSELFDNGRYTSSVLADEIRHAGFYGRFDEPTAPSSLPDPCETSASAISDHLGLAIQGYDDVTGTPTPGCLSDANHVDGTDILVVRRASRYSTAVGDLTAGRIYIQGGTSDYVVASADGSESSDKSTFDLTDRDGNREAIRPLRVRIYFVSPCLKPGGGSGDCSDSSDDGDPVPTLKRLDLSVTSSGTATFERTPVASGIQQLQLEYGIDGNDDGQPDNTNTSSIYLADPGSLSNWMDVVTARAHVLGRTIDTVTGHTDERSYMLGKHGLVGAFNDAYKRHLFIRTARLVNRSGRREVQ